MSSVERLRKRHASERRFRLYGLGAVWGVLGLLVFFLGSLVWTGLPALQAYEVRLDVSVPEVVPERARALRSVVRGALYGLFPEVVERGERRQLAALLGAGAEEALHARLVRAPGEKTVSVYLPVSGDADIFLKRGMGRISPEQARWLETLQESGRIRLAFNRGFFTSGDSRAPDRAGILGAIVGSGMVFMLLLVLVVPVGVLAAIYLEEFAPSNVVTDFFEINVNNLAAVPSIVFGLLGIGGVFEFSGAAALGAAGGRDCAGLDDAPCDCDYRACGSRCGAAVSARGGPSDWCVSDADGLPPRLAASHVGDPHRHHHRDRPRSGRNRTFVDDWYGGLHCGCSHKLDLSCDCLAGADLHLVQ